MGQLLAVEAAASAKPKRRAARAPDANALFPPGIKAALTARLTTLLSSVQFTLLTDLYDVAPLVALLMQHVPTTALAMTNPALVPPFPLAFHRLPAMCPAVFALVFAAIVQFSQEATAANAVAPLAAAPALPAPVAAAAVPAARPPPVPP
jgi:hypothetical protein